MGWGGIGDTNLAAKALALLRFIRSILSSLAWVLKMMWSFFYRCIVANSVHVEAANNDNQFRTDLPVVTLSMVGYCHRGQRKIANREMRAQDWFDLEGMVGKNLQGAESDGTRANFLISDAESA